MKILGNYILVNTNCHSDDRREEESREHPLCVPEILRYALDDNGCQQVIILPSREGVGGVLENTHLNNQVDKVDVYCTPLTISEGIK